MTQAPALVRLPNPIVGWLLRRGLPLGPNVLLTVRGRSSGLPRTAPVAVSEIDGRRYVIGAYGEVHWVRNLRAAREGTLSGRGWSQHIAASELDPAAARRFFGEALPRYVAGLPWFGRLFARVLFGLMARDILRDPDRAAAARPVFELTPSP